MLGRPSAVATNVMRLDSHHNQHWQAKQKKQYPLQRLFGEGPAKDHHLQLCQM